MFAVWVSKCFGVSKRCQCILPVHYVWSAAKFVHTYHASISLLDLRALNLCKLLRRHPTRTQVRLAGDRYVLVEYGPMELDLNLRVRVWALQAHLAAAKVRADDCV